MKKIAFFGTPSFTTDFLDTLAATGRAPLCIITNPDRPAGRGMALTSPAPKLWAETHGSQVLQPEKLDDAFFAELSKEPWDLFVVIAYGKIMPQRVIDLPKYGTINVHYSLLPKYRGATPVESAILNGDTETGVTIQQMAYKLDSGNILAQKKVPIDATDTTPTLRRKLNDEALRVLPEIITNIFEGTISPAQQDESKVTLCTKITKGMGELDLSDDGFINDRKYRAYYGWPGSYFFALRKEGNVRIKITKAHFENGQFMIDEVIPENGKRMSYQQYLAWMH